MKCEFEVVNMHRESLCYTNFFPYEKYRKEQLDLIRHLEIDARLGKNILLVAPNGSGKTIIALSALLPIAIEKKLKIIYVCRTHTQSSRVIKELRKMVQNTSHRINGLELRGRNQLCLNPVLRNVKLNPLRAMEICQRLRMGNSCSFFENLERNRIANENNAQIDNEIMEEFDIGYNNAHNPMEQKLFYGNFSKPVEAEEIIKFCEEKEYCPYYLSLYFLKYEQIVACNFHWVLNLEILSRFLGLLGEGRKFELNKCIIVIDECHNVIDMVTELNSNKLSLSTLISFLKELKKLKFPEQVHQKYRQFISYLIKNLQKKKELMPVGDTEIIPENFLKQLLNDLNLNFENFRDFLSQMNSISHDLQISAIRHKNLDVFELCIQNIRFVKFWNKFINFWSESYFFCYHVSSSRKNIFLELISIDPRQGMSSLYLKNYACVNLTGTVNPYVYINLTGLHQKKNGYKELIANTPFKSEHIKALVIEGVSTKKKNRTSVMYQKIIDKIAEVVSCTPGNVGVFCASYNVLKDLLKNRIYHISAVYGKKMFIEKPKMLARENSLMLKKFKDCSKSNKKGAILLGVCGGRNSEGGDFPGDYMNAVIIVGIPYHAPTLRTEARITYYNKIFNNQGWVFAYLSPAMQRANQAAGRPIRREEDKGAIVFLDSRFKDKIDWISDWIRKEIEIIPDVKGSITEKLKGFWKK